MRSRRRKGRLYVDIPFWVSRLATGEGPLSHSGALGTPSARPLMHPPMDAVRGLRRPLDDPDSSLFLRSHNPRGSTFLRVGPEGPFLHTFPSSFTVLPRGLGRRRGVGVEGRERPSPQCHDRGYRDHPLSPTLRPGRSTHETRKRRVSGDSLCLPPTSTTRHRASPTPPDSRHRGRRTQIPDVTRRDGLTPTDLQSQFLPTKTDRYTGRVVC